MIKTIGFLGCGNMGGAIARAVCKAADPQNVYLANRTAAKADAWVAEYGGKRADQLSTGMKQKCAIARTVVHEPQVVILDEPTTGLDVMSAKILLDFIASYKALRVPLIFSTHHLHEVEKLCDRVCIIDRGTTAFNGTVDELRGSGTLIAATAVNGEVEP